MTGNVLAYVVYNCYHKKHRLKFIHPRHQGLNSYTAD